MTEAKYIQKQTAKFKVWPTLKGKSKAQSKTAGLARLKEAKKQAKEDYKTQNDSPSLKIITKLDKEVTTLSEKVDILTTDKAEALLELSEAKVKIEGFTESSGLLTRNIEDKAAEIATLKEAVKADKANINELLAKIKKLETPPST